MLECELKFGFASPEEARSLLASRGVALSEPLFEQNAVLDRSDGSLAGSGILLRVRTVGGKVLLTVKTPVAHDRMKIRNEMETEIPCTQETLVAMLEAVGFHVYRTYSKSRSIGLVGNATVCLDVLHFGTFIELEAPDPDSLDRAVAALGLEPGMGIRLNYLELEDGSGKDV